MISFGLDNICTNSCHFLDDGLNGCLVLCQTKHNFGQNWSKKEIGCVIMEGRTSNSVMYDRKDVISLLRKILPKFNFKVSSDVKD